MTNWLTHVRVLMALMIFPKRRTGLHMEGNRVRRTYEYDHWRITIQTQDLSVPTQYGRESCMKMLRTVRENERRMDWRCPEPVEF